MKCTVSCIIPVFNEEKTISNVVSAAVACRKINEVIVVDDGSTDRTKGILSHFNHPKLLVLTLEKNHGKTNAVCAALPHAHGDILLLLDGDLVGLTPKNLEALRQPVLSHQRTASFAFLQNAPWIARMMGVNAVSGQRAFPKTYAAALKKKGVQGYGLEVVLNEALLQDDVHIVCVRWPHVRHRKKEEKRGFLRGWLADTTMTWGLIFRFGLPTLARQYHELSRRSLSP